jgi:hypothetical protein
MVLFCQSSSFTVRVPKRSDAEKAPKVIFPQWNKNSESSGVHDVQKDAEGLKHPNADAVHARDSNTAETSHGKRGGWRGRTRFCQQDTDVHTLNT